MGRHIIEGYNDDALIAPFESFETPQLFAPVSDYLPVSSCRVLDVGAGTGRDAAWFAARGHQVVAPEPAKILRVAGKDIHARSGITWLNDRLPEMPRLRARAQVFDLIIVNAVWHHLKAVERQAALTHLHGLLAPKGRLILSLRHGPTSVRRPGYPAPAGDTVLAAKELGMTCLAQRGAESVQPRNIAAGVTWTWLVLTL